MAESILKLRVESSEYDNKIKRAAEGLQRYADGCRKAGGTLTQLDDGVEEFVRALGSMETVSKSARGSISELTKSFTDLSVIYNKLTDEEKNAPFGQALRASLDEMKGRIQSGNAELKNIGSSLNDTGGLMDSLASKFTINIDALKLFDIGLKGAKAALDVAKDAFFASEANVDEWGRTMASAQSLYEGFVTSLNNSDFSGFLSNIDDIVKAAREAYNELDKLGTMKTIQTPQIAKQEAENTRMRTMLMTGRWISAGDGRQAPHGLKDGDILSQGMLKAIERQLQNGMNTIVSLTKNELGQTGKAIDAYYNSLAKQNGMSLKEFRQGTSSWAAFSQKMKGYEDYQNWRSQNYYTDNWGNRRVKEGNPYQEYAKWGTFRVDKMGQNSYNDLVNLIKQQQSQQSQMYSTIGQAYRTINRAEGITVKGLMNPGGSGGGGSKGGKVTEMPISGSIDEQTAKVQELQKAWRAAADDDSRKIIKEQLDEAQKVLDLMTGKKITIEAPEGSLKALNDELKKLQEARQLLTDPIEIEIQDQQIKEVQDEIDRLNGKKVEVELEVNGLSSFEQLQQSLKIKIAEQNMEVDTNTLQTLMKTAIENGIDSLNPDFASLQEKMREGMNIPDETWQKLQDEINAKLKELDIKPIKIDFQTGNLKNLKKDAYANDTLKGITDPLNKMTSGIGSIASGIQQLGIDIPEGLDKALSAIQGVTSILMGISSLMTIIASIQGVKAIPVIGWAASTGGVVHAADGYEVPGNHFSGDAVPSLLTSGEMVLNRFQQQALAASLQGNDGGGGYQPSRISGEQIWIAVNRYTKRTGRGELVTWK